MFLRAADIRCRTMNLIDTHCHLAGGRLRQQARAVLDRAAAAGVGVVVCASAAVSETEAAADLAQTYPNVFFTAGTQAIKDIDPEGPYVAVLESLARRLRNVAIGECGLDYYHGLCPRDVQQRVFARQLELARRLDKPIVVHTREAFDDTLAVLIASGIEPRRVAIHCCTEGPDNVKRLIDFGATVSFSGIVTFKNTDFLRRAAALVPDDRLLIETDSPYLSPEPVRKMKINEPANVAHVAACLARVRGVSVEALAEQTTANAVRFFALEKQRGQDSLFVASGYG